MFIVFAIFYLLYGGDFVDSHLVNFGFGLFLNSGDSDANNSFNALLNMLSILPESYKTWIDRKLLQNRNFIAHGENFNKLDGVVTLEDYMKLHDDVISAIDQFAEAIKEAANKESYRI